MKIGSAGNDMKDGIGKRGIHAMKFRRTCYALLGLGLLLSDASSVLAESVLPDPTTPSGHSRRYNTNGVEFGSDVELGKSGSTPGIILDQGNGTFRTQAVAAPVNGNYGWGLLGLLGLLGLSGLRRRYRDEERT